MNGTLTLPALIFSGDDGITFFDGTIQSTAYDASLNSQVTNLSAQVTDISSHQTDLSLNVDILNTQIISCQASNTNVSAISYDSFLNKTTINSNCYINSLTCGSVATNSGGDIQTQISGLQTQIDNIGVSDSTKYITSDNAYNTTIGGTIITGNVTAGGLVSANTLSASSSISINGLSIFNSLVPTGTIHVYAGLTTVVPSGYLLCNGSAISKTTYATLWNAIGDIYLAGRAASSTTFRLPDLRGVFIRGVGTNASYTADTVVGGVTGTFQYSSVQKHSHKYNMANNTASVAGASITGNSSVWDNSSDVMNTGNILYDTDNTTVLANETRPHCIAMNYIIKF
jgi:microcystin-dependent protein